MAFSDPIVFPSPLWNATTVAITGGVASSLSRVQEGEYVLDTSTTDEPYQLSIKNGPVTSNILPTRFAIQLKQFKNAPAGSFVVGTNPSDDWCIMEVSFRYVPRSFTNVELARMVRNSAAFLSEAALLKLMQGQR